MNRANGTRWGAKRQPTFSGGWSVSSRPTENLSNRAFLRRRLYLLSLATPSSFYAHAHIGIGTALESILEILPQIDHLPYSLISLVGITGTSNERQDTLTAQQMLDAPNGEDEHILLSKPANAEQLEIARRLERNNAVLVQGPPGTGKTHTIANLIGHLLAQA